MSFWNTNIYCSDSNEATQVNEMEIWLILPRFMVI